MSALVLKLVAMVTMLLDHTACMLGNAGLLRYGTPLYMGLRGIGRLAFPIYGFLLVEGAIHTKNKWKYLLRLLILVPLSEIPFNIAIFGRVRFPQGQNVFLTLVLGLIAVYGIQFGTHELTWKRLGEKAARVNAVWKWLGIPVAIVIVILCCAAAELLHTDYGRAGVLMISAMGVLSAPLLPLRRTMPERFIRCVFFALGVFVVTGLSSAFEIVALADLLLLGFYNGKKGYSNRILQYGCYLYYPAHLLILSLIFFSLR